MAINDGEKVKRIGNAAQALAKLNAPPNVNPAAAAPAPATQVSASTPVRALPAPQITVNSAGEAMTNADMSARATLGNTPDVARAAQVRAAGAPAVAPPPPVAAIPPVDKFDASAGARMRMAAQERLVQAGVAQGPLPQGTPAAAAPVAPAPASPVSTSPAARPGVVSRVASRATRFGASPSVPGSVGVGAGTAATLGAATMLGTAPEVATRDTEDYARRFGLDPNPDRGLPAELAIRGAGALTDLGSNLIDGLIAAPVDAISRSFGGPAVGRWADKVQQNDNPEAAQRWKESPANPDRQVAPAPDFSNVQSGVASGPLNEQANIPQGQGAANPATWAPDARAALNSTAPGTAVINGKVLTPQEIANAGSRINVMDPGAFGNVPYGVAAAELTGQVPELGSGPTRGGSGGFTAADRQQQLANIEAGPDKRIEQAAQSEKNSRDSLIGDIRSALRSGKRKTAGRLIELLQATKEGGAQAGGARASSGGAARSPAQEALTSAQTDQAQAGAEAQRSKAATDKRIAALQDAIVAAKTPEEAEAASKAIALLTGKDTAEKTRYAQGPFGPNGETMRLPLKEGTNEIMWPKGLSGVYTDAQGNTEKRALNQ